MPPNVFQQAGAWRVLAAVVFAASHLASCSRASEPTSGLSARQTGSILAQDAAVQRQVGTAAIDDQPSGPCSGALYGGWEDASETETSLGELELKQSNEYGQYLHHRPAGFGTFECRGRDLVLVGNAGNARTTLRSIVVKGDTLRAFIEDRRLVMCRIQEDVIPERPSEESAVAAACIRRPEEEP
jgi:hypothetical protein